MIIVSRCIWIALGVILLTGCAPTIEKWVEKRGFVYDPNYSTINKLGNQVLPGGSMVANPSFQVEIETGQLPNIESKRVSTFTLSGSSSIAGFVRAATNSAVVGDFERVASLQVVLDKPFIQRVSKWVPLGQCQPHSAVVEVLNTGDMRMLLEDKSGANITGEFEIKGDTADGRVSVTSGTESTVLTTGQNFYIGYRTRPIPCTLRARKPIVLGVGEQYTDDEVGISMYLLDTRMGTGGVPEALVMLSPYVIAHRTVGMKSNEVVSLIPPSPLQGNPADALLDIMVASREESVDDSSGSQESARAVWDRAVDLRGRDNTSVAIQQGGSILRVSFGTSVGFSVGNDGVHLRATRVEVGEAAFAAERVTVTE